MSEGIYYMVKMYRLKCIKELDSFFKEECTYYGRKSKSGMIMAKDEFDKWWIIEDYKMHTYNILNNHFIIFDEFFVRNHKEAIGYKSQ
jgi:hypothetical protein